MSQVYSTRFMSEANFFGLKTFTVPAGKTCVLRDVDCYIDGGLGPDGVTLRVLGVSGESLWYQLADPFTKIYGSWRGRQVFFETETWAISTNAGCDFAASGYLLSLP
jgi:hypothetical protein